MQQHVELRHTDPVVTHLRIEMNAHLGSAVILRTQIVESAKRLGSEPDRWAPLNEVGREQVEEIEIVRSDHLLPDPRKHHRVVEERVGADASAGKPDNLHSRTDIEFRHQVAPEERSVQRDVNDVLPTAQAFEQVNLRAPVVTELRSDYAEVHVNKSALSDCVMTSQLPP